MKTQVITTNSINTMYSIITGLILMTSYQAPASAEPWELRTATEEVQGTRDIEAGRLDKGMGVALQGLLDAARLSRLCGLVDSARLSARLPVGKALAEHGGRSRLGCR